MGDQQEQNETTVLGRRAFLGAIGAGVLAARLANAEAAVSDEPAWSFAVVADPHLREDRQGEPTGVAKFQQVLARLEALRPRPEFALLLGDIHPEKLAPLLPEIAVPLRPVMGNHEGAPQRKQLRELFPEEFAGRDYYAFTHRECLFLGLCTATPTDHIGHFESEFITPGTGQCAWLEAQLAAGQRHRHCFLFGHIPPERLCRPDGMCLAQNDARFLQALVRQHQPTALFFGHRHADISFDFGGAPLYGVRSCNWNFNKEPTSFLHVLLGGPKPEVRFVAAAEG